MTTSSRVRVARQLALAESIVIATLIFTLLLVILLSALSTRRWITLALFFVCAVSIVLLFLHHATRPVDINL